MDCYQICLDLGSAVEAVEAVEELADLGAYSPEDAEVNPVGDIIAYEVSCDSRAKAQAHAQAVIMRLEDAGMVPAVADIRPST